MPDSGYPFVILKSEERTSWESNGFELNHIPSSGQISDDMLTHDTLLDIRPKSEERASWRYLICEVLNSSHKKAEPNGSAFIDRMQKELLLSKLLFNTS